MDNSDQKKVFVGGISSETTEDVLTKYFTKYGVVSSSFIAKDRVSGKPRGFAFVTFSESRAVDRALQNFHRILNKPVEVKRVIPRCQQQTQHQHYTGPGRSSDATLTKKIFVGGLPPNLTEEQFRSYFERFGTINNVVAIRDNITGRPRGFGFITFDSEDSVEKATQRSFHTLAGKLVEVKRAVSKDARRTSNNGFSRGGSSSFYGEMSYGFSSIGSTSRWAAATPKMMDVGGSFLPHASPSMTSGWLVHENWAWYGYLVS